MHAPPSATSKPSERENGAVSSPRVLGVLTDDVHRPGTYGFIKYAPLFAALRRQCSLLGVEDVEVRGADRYVNALLSLCWPREQWRQAFYKNVWAFRRRTRRARLAVERWAKQTDVVFAHGALFDADLEDGPPVVIYADFTYQLARSEDPWRDPFHTERARRHWLELETRAYHSAAFVLTRSAYTRRSMVEDYGLSPDRVHAVGGGVNFDALPPPPSSQAYQCRPPRILFIGTDFERKGGPDLVRAFERVRQRISDAELWLVTAQRGSNGNGVRYLAPTTDRGQIVALYEAACVFAMPSRCETWGDVFLEAMSYGLPCIGASSDAMPEIITPGETGYLVDQDDVPALAERVEELLRDPARAAAMGQAGYERVSTQYTWDAVVTRMLPWLQRAAAGAKAASPTGVA